MAYNPLHSGSHSKKKHGRSSSSATPEQSVPRTAPVSRVTTQGAPKVVPQKRKLNDAPVRQTTPNARKQEPTKPVRLGVDVLYMTVLLAITMLFSAGLLQNQLVLLMPQTGQAGIRAILLFGIYLVELVALSYAAYRHHENFLDFFRLRIQPGAEEEKPTPAGGVSAVWVLGFLIVLRLLSMGWTVLTEDIGWRLKGAADVLDIFGKTNVGLIITIVLVVILAPVVEELVFRGLLQKWISAKTGTVVSIILTSLAFALYHLSFWAAPLNLALGATTGFLAHKCKTLYPAIMLHVLYNATLIVAAFYLASH